MAALRERYKHEIPVCNEDWGQLVQDESLSLKDYVELLVL